MMSEISLMLEDTFPTVPHTPGSIQRQKEDRGCHRLGGQIERLCLMGQSFCLG
jgi:hypothetical protein